MTCVLCFYTAMGPLSDACVFPSLCASCNAPQSGNGVGRYALFLHANCPMNGDGSEPERSAPCKLVITNPMPLYVNAAGPADRRSSLLRFYQQRKIWTHHAALSHRKTRIAVVKVGVLFTPTRARVRGCVDASSTSRDRVPLCI